MTGRTLGGSIAACLVAFAAPAAATTYYATAATLGSLFKSAVGGDKIVLRGTYGALTITGEHSGTGVVDIDARYAVVTDSFKIKDARGLNIYGGKYGSATAPTVLGRGIVVYGGSDITVRNAAFIGNKDKKGIEFIDVLRPAVWSSSFTDLWAGVAFTRVSDGTIAKNSVVGSVSDGYVVADSHTVLVDGNSCSGGAPRVGAHPDCVQMWSVLGHPVQSDITVSNNYAYGPTQGFTSFDPTWGGELRARIINNRVDTSYTQGIACYGCFDSEISGNVVTTLPGSTYLTNIRVFGGTSNRVFNNSIGPKPAALTMSGSASSADGFDLAGSAASVPEPRTWAMLVGGFGLLGAALRRRRPAVVLA